MDLNSWLLDGARDVVLLLIGAGVAWLSGLSAAKRTEKSEQRQREAVRESSETERLRGEEAARNEASAREARNGLSIVFDLDRGLETLPSHEAPLPEEDIARLRAIGLLIPNVVVRRSVGNFCDLANEWELMVNWAPSPSPIAASSERQFHARILVCLREVLAAAVRGDDPSTEESAELEMLAIAQHSAMDSYWASQAEDYEEMKLSDMGHSGSTRNG